MAAAFTPGKGKIVEKGKSLEAPCLIDGEREVPEGHVQGHVAETALWPTPHVALVSQAGFHLGSSWHVG